MKWPLAADSWPAAGRNFFQRWFSKSSGGSCWKFQVRRFCFSFFSRCALRSALWLCGLAGWLLVCVCVSAFLTLLRCYCYSPTVWYLPCFGLLGHAKSQKIIQYSLFQFRVDLGNLLSFKSYIRFDLEDLWERLANSNCSPVTASSLIAPNVSLRTSININHFIASS